MFGGATKYGDVKRRTVTDMGMGSDYVRARAGRFFYSTVFFATFNGSNAVIHMFLMLCWAFLLGTLPDIVVFDLPTGSTAGSFQEFVPQYHIYERWSIRPH